MIISTPSTQRPYRSHKVPACDLCRRRKLRCLIDIAGQACRYCRERDLSCEYSQKTVQESSRPHKRSRDLRDDGSVTEVVETARVTGANQARVASNATATRTQSSLLLNPPMAEDVEFLAAHSPGGAKPYSVMSSGSAIVYLTVPRVREGLAQAETGNSQKEIFEQILGSCQGDLLDLYILPICLPCTAANEP